MPAGLLERVGDSFSPQTRRLAKALGPRIIADFAAVAAGPSTFVDGYSEGMLNTSFGVKWSGGVITPLLKVTDLVNKDVQ